MAATYENVLVAMDIYRDHYRELINIAKNALKDEGSTLSVIYVVKSTYVVGLKCKLQRARIQLKEIGQSFGLDATRLHLRVGNLKTVLSQEAMQLKADLIVMGHSYYAGVHHAAEPLAKKALRNSPCDVLFIPRPKEVSTLGSLAPLVLPTTLDSQGQGLDLNQLPC